ncbi:MAG: response regulator [Nitrospirae bacterium]|nr:MAG: response regulator [Nitrospirota bacterium]
MRILIIDDSVDQRQLLETFLKAGGYADVVTAESLPDAFTYASVNDPDSPGPKIDLILMDIEMPELNGIDACQQIKEIPHLKDIPILMVTVATATSTLVRAFAAGAVDYITKPVNKFELLARVRSALALKQEMDRRKARERELTQRTEELEASLQEVKTLRGCFPMCVSCKKIRDDRGYWNQIEVYVEAHSEAEFSLGRCPECVIAMAGKAGAGGPRPKREAGWPVRLQGRLHKGSKQLLLLLGVAIAGVLLLFLFREFWSIIADHRP